MSSDRSSLRYKTPASFGAGHHHYRHGFFTRNEVNIVFLIRRFCQANSSSSTTKLEEKRTVGPSEVVENERLRKRSWITRKKRAVGYVTMQFVKNNFCTLRMMLLEMLTGTCETVKCQ